MSAYQGLFPRPATAPIADLAGKRYTFHLVPAGTKVAYCRGPNCHRSFYWIKSISGAKPIDCNVVGGELPSINAPGQIDAFVESEETRGAPAHDGKGVLHHHVCPDVELFAKEKRERMVQR